MIVTSRVRYSARQVPVKGGYRIETPCVRYHTLTPRVRYSARQVPAKGGYRIETPRYLLYEDIR